MARHDVIRYRMSVIKAIREGEAWDPGPNFLNGDRALKAAANYFGLWLSDRGDREELLRILAEVLFGREIPGRRKGQTAWTGERLIRLGRLAKEIRQKNPKLKGDVKISQLIFAQHKGFQSADAVRRQLPAARRALLKLEN
jgi:hypothetical protein